MRYQTDPLRISFSNGIAVVNAVFNRLSITVNVEKSINNRTFGRGKNNGPQLADRRKTTELSYPSILLTYWNPETGTANRRDSPFIETW